MFLKITIFSGSVVCQLLNWKNNENTPCYYFVNVAKVNERCDGGFVFFKLIDLPFDFYPSYADEKEHSRLF